MERPDNEDLLQISFHWKNSDETHFTMCHAVALILVLSRTYSFLGFDTQQRESGTGTFLWFVVAILKPCISFSWIVRVQGLVWSCWGGLGNLGHILKSKNTMEHKRTWAGAQIQHSDGSNGRAAQYQELCHDQVPFWLMLLTTFLRCTSHLPGWQEQSEQLQVLMCQRGPGTVGAPEDNIKLDRATPCLQGEWLGRDVAAGHFGLFICFFPGFSIIQFWGALIFILACFSLCCTPSWGPASCRHAILILGPNFRAFIPVWNNARVTEISQNTTCDISTLFLAITFYNSSVKY